MLEDINAIESYARVYKILQNLKINLFNCNK